MWIFFLSNTDFRGIDLVEIVISNRNNDFFYKRKGVNTGCLRNYRKSIL